MVNAATGLKIDVDEMLKIGERNYNLLKILAARGGVAREDDGLPKRLRGPLPRGASADEPIPEEELQKRIDEYYEARGWNDRGPTKEKLEELDMGRLRKYC